MNESQRLAYLEAMGIPVWKSIRPSASGVVASAAIQVAPAIPQEAKLEVEPPNPETNSQTESGNIQKIPSSESCDARENHSDPVFALNQLEQQVANCTRCALHETRKQTVFASGSEAADWMIIGEAPGASEDEQGKPFVGRAGQLLTEMLRAIGLERETVYIANILKCRPPDNRDPLVAEVEQCESYLQEQVQLVRPKVILAMGRVAAQNLLKTDRPIGKLRGEKHHYQGIPVVVVYHPAYLLRSPLEKRKAWADLQFARQICTTN